MTGIEVPEVLFQENPQDKKTRELFIAVRAQDVIKVGLLLNPNKKKDDRRKPQRKQKSSREETKDNHPEQPVNINARDVSDPLEPTPLLLACEAQNLDIVRLLIDAKPRRADVNIPDKRGKKPIWWAAKYGNAEMAEILLKDSQQDCEVNYVDRESGCTPLYRSILSNATELCRHMIHAGADVNLRRLGMSGDSASAESPLIKTIQLDNYEICEMLLNSMCDMEAKNEDGLTALHFAVAYKRYDLCRLLLSNRAKINAKGNKGVTPMTVALEQRSAAMCRILIEYGYKMDQKFTWDETPLEMAISCHSEVCAMTLVHWGCKLKAPFPKTSYFLQACCEGLMSLSGLLLDVNPLFLNEGWIQERQIPLALYRKPAFYEWLCEESTSPRSLSLTCRAAIFHYLGKYACVKVQKLPLPEKLKAFVGFSEHFHPKMYEEMTVYTDECPYDCNANCPKIQCPSLDFTSSSEDIEISDS